MKKALSIALLVMLLFTLTSASADETTNDAFYNEADSIQVVDAAGRKVSFPEPAMTVATSWGGGIDQYLFALGVSDRIVATNGKHTLDKMYFDPSEMPKAGKWALDKEGLAEVSPDLFLHGAAVPEYLDGANQVGVRSYGMGFFTFDDVFKNLEDLGVIFGIEDRAQYAINYCKQILEMVDSRVAEIPDEEKLTAVVLGEKTGELASDLFATVDAMVERAGGISCTPSDIAAKTETTIVGLETIFQWNPDVVFLQDYECELTVDGIMNDPIWSSMTSVQNGCVFAVPSTLDPWFKSNPACVLGTLYMSAAMYPARYSDVDIEQVALDFYKNVYELELTSEELGII